MATRQAAVSAKLQLDGGNWAGTLSNAGTGLDKFTRNVEQNGVRIASSMGKVQAAISGSTQGNTLFTDAAFKKLNDQLRGYASSTSARSSPNYSVNRSGRDLPDALRTALEAQMRAGLRGLTGGGYSGNTANSPASRMANPEASTADAGIRRSILTQNGTLEDGIKRTGRAMQEGTKASSRFGQGLLQIGYLADDAAYGMRGMMNNIAPVVMGLGAGAGVAGALQILGAALQQGMKYWDEWSGATARAERAARQAQERMERMADSSARAAKEGEKRALLENRHQELMDASSASNQRRLDLAERLSSVEAEAARAQASSPRAHLRSPAENARRELASLRAANEAERKNETDSGMARLTEARRALAEEQKTLARIGPQVRAGEPRLEYLQERKSGRDHSIEVILARMEANTKEGKFSGKIQNTKLEAELKRLQSENDEQTKLEGTLPTLRALRDKLDRSELPSTISGLEQQLGPEAAAREKIRQAKEAAAAAEVDRAQFSEAMSIVGGAARKVAGEFEYLFRVGQMGVEKARREEQQGKLMRDLGISEIRSPRRRSRVQRSADLADETKRLMLENPGMDEGTAADIANRRQIVRDRASGKRTIRSLAPADRYEGLDGFKRAPSNLDYGDKPLPGEKERAAAKERGARALRKAKEDVEKASAAGGSDPGFKIVADKLDRLIDAVQKPVAERIQPASRP